MQKKILVVYDVGYPFIEGGGQRRLWEIARRLVSNGYGVDWVCFKSWVGDDILIDDSGIRFIGLAGFNGLYNKKGGRRKLEPLEFLVALLRSGLNYDKYDYIWSGQWPILHLVWWLIFSKDKIYPKLTVDWWEIWGRTWFSYSKTIGWIGYLFESILLSRLIRNAKLVLISPNAYRKAEQINRSQNIFLINNGINLLDIDEAEAESDQFDVIYFGRLKNHKNISLLIKAIGVLNNEKKKNYKLAIVGDGPERVGLTDLVSELDLDGDVTFFGEIASTKQLYSRVKSASLYVNPSTKEGGGSIALFEAYAAGLPAIFFKCEDGIDEELMLNGKTGFIVHEISQLALADKIEAILQDSILLKEMKTNTQLFAARFDWGKIALIYQNEIFIK